MRFLGLDTSNYRTSAAIFDAAAGKDFKVGRLLAVEAGARGLRQSDALFLHTRALPSLLEELYAAAGHAPVAAVGVSDAPRAVEGSYMPCFLAGLSAAGAAACALGVPLCRFSHQMGHIAAAAASAGVEHWLDRPFLAWHLSGGTTELVAVRPRGDGLFSCEIVAATADISAGQVIDRLGVRLGLAFPCGAELESLAARGNAVPARPSLREGRLSLSGLENKACALLERGASAEDAAAFVMASVTEAVAAATEAALLAHPRQPLLFSGGVSANAALRRCMEARFGARFPAPDYAGDNAAGIARLCGRIYRRS